ncbi:hypothetical protein M0805_002116 [Coniferiporia weirii]|nr:hypothetical protein M0805_002116 [Coniferiporia weirii]
MGGDSGSSGGGSDSGGNGGNSGQNNKPQLIDDTDVTIVYHGNWQLTLNESHEKTFHSTNDPNASAFLSFHGSQISVLGNIPTGQDKLAANYSVDDGFPVYRAEPALAQNSSLVNQMLFISEILPVGQHNITINAINGTGDRNYTITDFLVSTMENTEEKPVKKKNVGAIVGGVLGALIFLSLLFLGSFYVWRKRRISQTSYHRRLPPMLQYVQPAGYGSPTGGRMFSRMSDAELDTDSKFTFDVPREAPQRKSWVTVSLPRSAIVNDRPVSDWSSYKGSSVVVERSHFSPYTTATLSPMAFIQQPIPPPPPPVPRRVAPPAQLEDEIVTTSTMSSSLLRGRDY